MDVPISEFRADLRAWVEKAKNGENVVVTERGIPVVRVTAVDAMSVIQRLEAEGTITPPKSTVRRRSTGRSRVKATGSVSDYIAEFRR